MLNYTSIIPPFTGDEFQCNDDEKLRVKLNVLSQMHDLSADEKDAISLFDKLASSTSDREYRKAKKKLTDIMKKYGIFDKTDNKAGIEIVEIVGRNCSDKVQPDIQPGKRYLVKGKDSLKNGTEVLILQDAGSNKTFRCNAGRFSWKHISEDTLDPEEAFHQEVKSNLHELLHSFTFEEHMQIAFLPLIISHCAWYYTEAVLQECAEHKIPEVKGLSRTVKMVRQEYYNSLRKDLNSAHLAEVQSQGDRFLQEFSSDFTIMFFSIRAEVLKSVPDDPYTDMRTYAFMVMLICDYYIEQSHRCDQLIASRTGKIKSSVINPKIAALRGCMDAYTGTIGIDVKNHISRCIRIFENNLSRINFTIQHEQRIAPATVGNHQPI